MTASYYLCSHLGCGGYTYACSGIGKKALDVTGDQWVTLMALDTQCAQAGTTKIWKYLSFFEAKAV